MSERVPCGCVLLCGIKDCKWAVSGSAAGNGTDLALAQHSSGRTEPRLATEVDRSCACVYRPGTRLNLGVAGCGLHLCALGAFCNLFLQNTINFAFSFLWNSINIPSPLFFFFFPSQKFKLSPILSTSCSFLLFFFFFNVLKSLNSLNLIWWHCKVEKQLKVIRSLINLQNFIFLFIISF